MSYIKPKYVRDAITLIKTGNYTDALSILESAYNEHSTKIASRSKRYYDKHKNDPEFMKKHSERSKKSYKKLKAIEKSCYNCKYAHFEYCEGELLISFCDCELTNERLFDSQLQLIQKLECRSFKLGDNNYVNSI